MEREGSIFLGLEKYLHASSPMRSFSFSFSTCRLAAPRRSLVSSVSAIPSPYSEVSTVCSDFRALLFFPLTPSFFPHSRFISASLSFCSFAGVLASVHREIWILRPVCIVWDLCLPRAHTGENLFGRWKARTRVRACGCLLAGGDKDRSWRAWCTLGWKNRETQGHRQAHVRGGGWSNGRVVRPNDDIPWLRSKFSQLTSRICRRETRIFKPPSPRRQRLYCDSERWWMKPRRLPENKVGTQVRLGWSLVDRHR